MKVYYALEDGIAIPCETGHDLDTVESLQNAVVHLNQFSCTPDAIQVYEPGTDRVMDPDEKLPSDTTPDTFLQVVAPEKVTPSRRLSTTVIPHEPRNLNQKAHRRSSNPMLVESKETTLPDHLKVKCYVKWGHQTLQIKMDPDEPCLRLKRLLEEGTGVAVHEQRISYCGNPRPFQNDKSLRYYGCQGGGFFELKRGPSTEPGIHPRRATCVAQAPPMQMERRTSLITTQKEKEMRRLMEEAAKLAEEEEAAAEAARQEEERLAREVAQKLEEERLAREAAEAEAQRMAEEAERLAQEAERLRLEREAEEARKQAEEAARRQAEEEEAARKKAEEEWMARVLEEQKKAEEEARKRAAEEAARKKAEEEARLAAEAEARKRAAEEAARKKAEEEAKKKAEEEARKRAAEESARKKAEEDARLAAEEEARKRAAQEAARKKAEEEARLEAARKAAEEEARRRAEEEAKLEAERKAAEEAAKKKAEEEWMARVLEEQRKADEAKRAKEAAEREEAERIAAETYKKGPEKPINLNGPGLIPMPKKLPPPVRPSTITGPGLIGMPEKVKAPPRFKNDDAARSAAPIDNSEEAGDTAWNRAQKPQNVPGPGGAGILDGPGNIAMPKVYKAPREGLPMDDGSEANWDRNRSAPMDDSSRMDDSSKMDNSSRRERRKSKKDKLAKMKKKEADDGAFGWPSRQYKYEFTPTPMDMSRQRVWYQLEGDFVPYYIKFNGWEKTNDLKRHILNTRRQGRNAVLLEGIDENDLSPLRLYPPGVDEQSADFLQPEDSLDIPTSETNPILVIVGEYKGFGREKTPLTGRREEVSNLWNKKEVKAN